MGHPCINIELVSGRCTAFAAEFLRDLERHPAFPALLTELAQIDGPIFRGDIEHALSEILRPDA